MMNRSFARPLALSACAAAAASVSVARADDLLTVDLSVPNQITITATTGLSAATVYDSAGTGIYLDGFFSAAGGDLLSIASGATFTAASNTANGTPGLYRSTVTDLGLNVYSWTDDNGAHFYTGQQAFTGTATWTVDPGMYAEMLAGGTSGDLYFAADDIGDIGDGYSMVIGTWRVVPTPGAAALLGLGGLVAGRRRRA